MKLLVFSPFSFSV